MDAAQWALHEAGDAEAGFFTAAYATEKGLKNEPVLACALPPYLKEGMAVPQPRKPELYLRPTVTATELDDGRHVMVAWFGLRLVTGSGEAKWIARANPCGEGEDGFGVIQALPDMESLKVFVYPGKDPLAFELKMGMGLRTQLARVLGAVTGCDRFTREEYDGTCRLQMDDAQSRAALVHELFPDDYPA